MNKYAFLIASDKSNSGKTILSIALTRYFSNNDYKVIPFKCGPDYIDTKHLADASKSKAYNLDTVLMSDDLIKSSFNEKLKENDIAIVEGVMGFYDGIDFKDFKGSSYDIAAQLNLPVIFILDVSASSFSVAARVKGLISLSKNIRVAGVILNKVSSKKHENMVKNAIEYHTGVEVLGAIYKNEELQLKSRHLGIKTAVEVNDEVYSSIASICAKYIDFEKLLKNTIYTCEFNHKKIKRVKKEKTAYITFDKAFNFYYQDNIDFLENNGFKIKYFSPLNNEIPENPDFIYFGGGYPELYAEKLADAVNTKESILNFAKKGIHILSECGGMMFLSKGIFIKDKFFEMCNVFDVTVEMTDKRQVLGYVSLKPCKKTAFFNLNDSFIGHEFHYSKIKDLNEDYIFEVTKITTDEKYFDGFYKYNTLSSYTHFHFLSKNNIIKNICLNGG